MSIIDRLLALTIQVKCHGSNPLPQKQNLYLIHSVCMGIIKLNFIPKPFKNQILV